MNRFSFVGGNSGEWRITSVRPSRGEGLQTVPRLRVVEGECVPPQEAAWLLEGFTSNLRYATRAEVEALARVQPPLCRPEATCAALIPLRKSAAWWALSQDERRAIFEETSHHTAIGLEYLPAIARRLHHCRDIGGPFDFLTWFEFAPNHKALFEELVERLRATTEWQFVEREIDVRLER